MSHLVETMAYQKAEKPWHGLGNPVNAGMSVDEMLIAAGLDWENKSEELFIARYVDGNRIEYVPLDTLNKDNTKYRAIIRQSDGFVHNIMSDGYKIVQNREVMSFLREYVEAAGMTLETAGALKHGSLIWVLAKIDASFALPGNDLNETYLLLSNSHDGSQEFQGQFTSIRVVCANTIRMAQSAKRGRSFSLRHSANLTEEIIKDAKLQLGMAVEMTEKYSIAAETMAATAVTPLDRLEYVAKLTTPKLLDAIVTESSGLLAQIVSKQLDSNDFNKAGRDILLSIMSGPGADMESSRDTVWGLLNGVTNYVDHVAGKGRDAALTSAWFGPGASMKEKAYNLAVELVNR